MNLYLTIFERQAKFLNIPEKTWTAYLIGSLPLDIAQLIAREDDEGKRRKINLLEDPMITTHLDPLEQYLDSQVTKTEGRNPIQCYGCGTPGVVKSSQPARELMKWKQQ
ncbi:hypothetical protein TNCV_3068491 [Trichonephila clavipes]|nr:hypothetical protein TNCV_3068491 [Trichonephila clavipes]